MNYVTKDSRQPHAVDFIAHRCGIESTAAITVAVLASRRLVLVIAGIKGGLGHVAKCVRRMWIGFRIEVELCDDELHLQALVRHVEFWLYEAYCDSAVWHRRK